MDQREKEQHIKDNAKRMRAEVIGHAIEVEDMLTEALGNLYGEHDDRFSVMRLINDIIADLTFDKKIQLFSKFVKLAPECFTERPGIIKDLYEIKAIRNHMAHRSTDVPWIIEEQDETWQNSVLFNKAGKPGFEFDNEALKSYKNICEYAVLIIVTGLNRLLEPIKPLEK